MKYIQIISLLILQVSTMAWGQTNSFPPSGNVKIFAAEDSWGEGICVVRPSGWSGIRFARNNPSSGNFNGNWSIGYNLSTGNDLSISANYNGIQYDGIFHISISSRNVGIGTTNPGTYKLAVEGKIGAREVNITAANPWPDYVFENDYKLAPLEELKVYLDRHPHLPAVPTAKEVEKNGVNVGEMNCLLLKKVEELTLHLIEIKKENGEMKKRLDALEKN